MAGFSNAALPVFWRGAVAVVALAVAYVAITARPRDPTGMLALGFLGVAAVALVGYLRITTTLRRHNRLHETILATVNEGIVVRDRAGNVVVANKSAERIIGLNASQLSGYAPVPPGVEARLADGTPLTPDRAPSRQATVTGQPLLGVEHSQRFPSGEVRWLRTDAWPLIHQETGAVEGAFSSTADITALREGERRSAQQAELLTRVLDTVAEGIVVRDREGKVTLANESALTLLELTREQLFGDDRPAGRRNFYEDGTPVTPATAPAQRTLREGRMVNAVTNLQLADGVERWLLINSQPIHTAAGAIDGAVASFLDITERKLAEQRAIAAREDLAVTSARWESMFAASPAAIWVLDRDLRVLLWNPAAERTYGWRSEEVVGHQTQELLIPIERWEHRSGVLERVRNGEIVTVESQHYHRDGRLVDVLLSGAPLLGADGAATGFLFMSEDVTALKAAERHVRTVSEDNERQLRLAQQTLARLEAVLDATSDGILLVDGSGHILASNRSLRELFPAGDEDIQQEQTLAAWLERVGAMVEDAGALRSFVEAIVATSTSQAVQVIEQCWPEQRTLRVTAARVQEDTNPDTVLLGFTDMTEEIVASRAKDELISLFGHEMKTPLTAIQGYADLLATGASGALDDEVREGLHIIWEAADNMQRMLNDLLDVSKIEAGRVTLHIRPVDVNVLVRRAIAALQPTLTQKAHRLELDLAGDLPRAFGDPVRLTEVLYNLLSNAIKYTDAGGVIAVTTTGEDGRVRVCVADSGIGMSPYDQARVFTKFFRANHPKVRQASGTGLGLVIVKLLVELHGGALHFTSVLGEGTQFSFTVPAVSGSRAPALSTGAGPKVLVVEDDPRVAFVFQRFLEAANYRVTVAGMGRSALDLVRAEGFDALTLDMDLPDLPGSAVLEALRSEPNGAALPVVVVSGAGPSQDSERFGVRAWLEKPVKRTVLLEVLESLLGAKSATA